MAYQSILMILASITFFGMAFFGDEKSRDSNIIIANIWLAASFIYPAIA